MGTRFPVTVDSEFRAKIPQSTGAIYYVSASGADTNDGTDPTKALATIGAAISAVSAGGAIVVGAGTYTETGLDLDVASVTLRLEPGVVIDPATGTALTISGARCMVDCPNSSALITPAANATGMLVSGAFCYVNDVRVSCGSSADLGFDVTGNGCVLRNCRCSSPLIAAFKVQGDRVKLEECCTGGDSGDSSIGFWFTNSLDKPRAVNCGSQGHETAGLQVDSGCTNGCFESFRSGGGDGRWSLPAESGHTLAGFNSTGIDYDKQLDKLITFDGSTAYDLFKVTGAVRISNITGIVRTQIENAACTIYLQAYSTNGTADITDAPGPSIQNLVAGCALERQGSTSDDLDVADVSGGPALSEPGSGPLDGKNAIDIHADPGATTTVRAILSAGLNTGAIEWTATWEPLDGLSGSGFVEMS